MRVDKPACLIREGVQKKRFYLGLSPKQRTPPTHPPLQFRTFRKLTRLPNFHEQKIICLEWSNMPYKHDIVLSLKQFRTLDPHPLTVQDKVLKNRFFGHLPKCTWIYVFVTYFLFQSPIIKRFKIHIDIFQEWNIFHGMKQFTIEEENISGSSPLSFPSTLSHLGEH